MKRLLQLVVCLGLFSGTAFAGHGGFGERLFFQVGGTIGADVTNVTGNFQLPSGVKQEFSNLHISYATLMGVARINFLEMTNNSSFDLAFRPSFGFGHSSNETGGGNAAMLRLPLTLDFNSGAASTVSTRAKTGFSLGVGAEYVMFPLNKDIPVYDLGKNAHGSQGSGANNPGIKYSCIQPVVVFGVKFFGKHYYCREINFKASFVQNSSLSNNTVESDETNNFYGKIHDFQSVGLMISFLQYLNY